ncbi:MAG: ABC transporter permease [Flexilinea sp.]
MINYIAFTKKELLESVRTYKLLIMLIVFFIFGIMSPLAAKMMPEILGSVMPEGLTVTLSEPAAIDSWTQFFKNVSQMGLVVTVIIFSEILGAELSKGTLINMLTKGLSRSTIILSKYTAMTMIWTVSYAAAFIVTWGYTVYLFPDGGISNLLFSVFCLWLFGMFLLAILLFASTLIKSNYGALLISGAVIVVLMLCNIVPNLQKYNPLLLASDNVSLLAKMVEVSSLSYAVAISILCSVILMIASILVFRKRQL